MKTAGAATPEVPTRSAAPPPPGEDHSPLLALARGGTLVVAGILTAQALGVFCTWWIARTLGPDQFGLLALAIAVITPLVPVASMGLSQTLIRFLPSHLGKGESAQIKGILGSASVLALLSSALATVLLFWAAPWIANGLFSEPRLTMVLRAMAVAIPFSTASRLALASTRALRVMHYDAMGRIAPQLLRLLGWALALQLLASSLDAAIWSYVGAMALSAVIAVVFVFRAFRGNLSGRSRWQFARLLRYALPLLGAALIYALAPKLDRMILATLAETREVGVYSVAASLAALLLLIHTGVVTSFVPMVADAYHRVSRESARILYLKATSWDASLTFLLVAGVVLLGREVVLVFGTAYQGALLPLMILTCSVYVRTLPGPTGAFLAVTNRQRIELLNSILVLAVGAAMQWIGGRALGMPGLALGVLATYLLLNIVQWLEIWWIYGFQPFRDGHGGFTLASAGALSGAVYLGMGWNLGVRLLALVLCGALLAAYFWFYRHEDLRDVARGIGLQGVKG